MQFEDLIYYVEKFKFQQKLEHGYYIDNNVEIILNTADFQVILVDQLNETDNGFTIIHNDNGILKYDLHNYTICCYSDNIKNINKEILLNSALIILNIKCILDENYSYPIHVEEIIYSPNERIIQNIIE